MIKRISYILLTILLCFSISSHPTYAAEHTNDSSFFSIVESSLLTFIKNTYNKQVLADQITPTPVPSTPQPPSLPTPLPTISIVSNSSLSTISAYILDGVNEYRASLGLSHVQSSTQTCAFAAIRAQEISHGF